MVHGTGFVLGLLLLAPSVRANPIAAGEFIYACQSDSGFHVKISYNCGDSADYPTNCALKAVTRDGVKLDGDWLGTLSDSSADLGSGVTGTTVKGYWCDCHVKPGEHTYSVGSDFGDADVTVTEPGTSGAGTDFCYEGAACETECAAVPPPPDIHLVAARLVKSGTGANPGSGTGADPEVPTSDRTDALDQGGCSISAVRALSAGPLALLALGVSLLVIRRRRRG